MDKSSRVHARGGGGGGGGGGSRPRVHARIGGGGGGGGTRRPENSLDNVFLVLNCFTVFRGDPIFSGVGGESNFFQGRVQMLSIETHITCDFPGRSPDPLSPSGSAHGVAGRHCLFTESWSIKI